MRLVLASNNAKKLAELAGLLAALPVELVTQSSLGIAEAEEPHHTFVENALAKARHAARAAGSAAMADDSGLCVDALGGAPGVISAHYAPLPPDVCAATSDRETLRRLQDAANNTRLLDALRGNSDRRAHYVAVLVAVRHPDDPEPLIATGRWDGVVLEAPTGSGGFGYDPLMRMTGFDGSVAEMPPAVKQAHSHRAAAARALAQQLQQAWHLG